MSTINKKLMGFVFSGSTLNLASAAFKSSINSITGFNSAGSAYVSYRPSSTFNSLTQLQQDGVYIVDAKTLGFDLPGATLTAVASPTGPVAGPLSIQYFSQVVYGGDPAIRFTPVSSGPDDRYVLARVTSSNSATPAVYEIAQTGVPFTLMLQTGPGENCTLDVANAAGNVVSEHFTTP